MNTHYVEIPLPTSVIQIDSNSTRNVSGDRITRIMTGRYSDPSFGITEARAIFNIAPPITTIRPQVSATYDSLVLQLNLDFYYFGSSDETTETLEVYEVLDTIYGVNFELHSHSQVEIGSSPLGNEEFIVNPSTFDAAAAVNADSDTSNNITTHVRVNLGGAMGPNLLNDMILHADDSLILDPTQFTGKYRGLALQMPLGNKIVGFDPRFTLPAPKVKDTKLSLYYTEDSTPKRLDFVLFYADPGVSFTTLTTDRSATVLGGIESFKDFIPADNRFYVQSGTALVTKVDLKNYYQYMDTIENAVFNSAELVVNNTYTSKVPQQVQFRILDSTNHFRRASIDSVTTTATRILDPFFDLIARAIFPGLSSFDVIDISADQGSIIPVQSDGTVGKVFITEFCQQSYNHKSDPRRVKAIGLMPVDEGSASQVKSGEFGKSVNGLVLDPIMLRLYYSIPVVKIR